MSFIRRLASKLPSSWQYNIKRIRYIRQIRNNKFYSDEPEFQIMGKYIKPGDWVIDIGANVGYYTKKFSELVGSQGRVLAFEPITETFSILASNVRNFKYNNVTMFNCAVSDNFKTVSMELPYFDTGIRNYFEAKISQNTQDSLRVIALKLDSLELDVPITFVKIDTEGHEESVLVGMTQLIEKYHPSLMIEINSEEIMAKIEALGYSSYRIAQSQNAVFTYLNK